MDVISVLVQKKVISNTTFEGNTMIIIEVWQTILANKMIMHKSLKSMVYEYQTHIAYLRYVAALIIVIKNSKPALFGRALTNLKMNFISIT